jgi:ribose transport system substrate-binding protein
MNRSTIKRRSSSGRLAIALGTALGLLLTACGAGGPSTETVSTGRLQTVDISQPAHGPNGEPPTPAGEVTLSNADVAKLKQGDYTAALLWAGSGDWYNAVSDGALARFKQLGIDVVAKSSADFDPARQANDVESAMAEKPDIIFTLPVDPVSAARAFKPAVEAGTVLVFADNGIDGYKAGKEYESIVTSSHYEMGEAAAKLMSQAMGGEGEIGIIYHDADFYVTNQRDDAFYTAIKRNYPDVDVAAANGFVEEGGTGDIASTMLTQNPDLDGIYVAWDVAAEPVIDALRSAGNEDTKVVTYDLGATNDVDMAQGGNMYGTVVDLPFDIGFTMATIAGRALLGKKSPPYITVGLMKITQDNLVEGWQKSLHREPPAEVKEALGQ